MIDHNEDFANLIFISKAYMHGMIHCINDHRNMVVDSLVTSGIQIAVYKANRSPGCQCTRRSPNLNKSAFIYIYIYI